MHGMAQPVMQEAIEQLEDFGPSLEVNGVVHHRVAPTVGKVRTMFGTVSFPRSRDRPRKGTAIVPVEGVLAIATGGLTQVVAKLTSFLGGHLASREIVRHGATPAARGCRRRR